MRKNNEMTYLSNLLDKLLLHPAAGPWIGTAFVALTTLVLSRIGEYSVRNNARSVDAARSLRITLRYVFTLFFLTGLAFVWAEQVKHFVFAAAALLASLLLVSKDLVMCLLGDVVKFYGKLCPIGQVVEIDGVKGEVLDSGFLTTSLQVIEHSYSGKIITYPNSVFLFKPVTHLSKTGEYRLVFVRIPVSANAELDTLLQNLLEIVTELVQPYQVDAEAHLGKARETLLMDFPSMAPRVLLEPRNFEEVVIAARFVCPANQRSTLEQEILKRFYSKSKGN